VEVAVTEFVVSLWEGAQGAGLWLWDTLGPVGTLGVAAVGLFGLVIAVRKCDAE
jgi:hypothetical protein